MDRIIGPETQEKSSRHSLLLLFCTGGLIFFEEYKGTQTHELLIIYVGVALMISAMVTIAFCEFPRL